MRLWRLPPVCLDNRRLNAQHNETLIALSVMKAKLETGKSSGWVSSPQLVPFWGRRGAVYDYYNSLILPACKARFHKSEKYAVRKPLNVNELPEDERDFEFWPHVTWREVLRDCRHLIEKHKNDIAKVEIAAARGVKTRVVRPTGMNEVALHLVFRIAIERVFEITGDEVSDACNQLMAERLLDVPK